MPQAWLLSVAHRALQCGWNAAGRRNSRTELRDQACVASYSEPGRRRGRRLPAPCHRRERRVRAWDFHQAGGAPASRPPRPSRLRRGPPHNAAGAPCRFGPPNSLQTRSTESPRHQTFGEMLAGAARRFCAVLPRLGLSAEINRACSEPRQVSPADGRYCGKRARPWWSTLGN